MLVAIYARVSTSDKNQDPETQLIPLREYCVEQGWTICYEYVDYSPAGDMARRTAWRELMASASRHKFDLLLFWRLDRAFRSVLDSANTLEQLRSWRVGLRSYSEPWLDTTSPFGEALYYITAAYAQLERGIISERVKAGMERARLQGVSIGRPQSVEHVDVDLVFDLRLRGRSWREVGQAHPAITLPSGKSRRPSVRTLQRAVAALEGLLCVGDVSDRSRNPGDMR